MLTFNRIEKISIMADPDSLADIEPGYYFEMAEAMIARHFGGEYEYAFQVAPTTGHGVRVTLRDDSDPQEYETTIANICSEAFNACCQGNPVPNV